MLADGWFEPEHFPAWRRRVTAERAARTLTRGYRDVLVALTGFVGDAGLFPSDASLAAAADYSTRTVRRARAAGRKAGLLAWETTRRLVDGRWVQGSNRYTLLTPDEPVAPRAPRPPPVCSGGQNGRRTEKEVSKRLPSRPANEGPAGFTSWQEVAQHRQERVAAAWRERKSRHG